MLRILFFSACWLLVAVTLLPADDYAPIADPRPILNDWPAKARVEWSKYIRPIMPGVADPVRTRLYGDYTNRPSAAGRAAAQGELEAYLRGLSRKQWPEMIPVNKNLGCALNDVVFYDGLGYATMRTFLMRQGVRNVLLIGYTTDMCVISSMAGYQNLTEDFNVFLVGDVTLAAWPVTVKTPNGYTPHSTTTALIAASQHHGKHPLAITQSSWIEPIERNHARR